MKQILNSVVMLTAVLHFSACGGTFASPIIVSIVPADDVTGVDVDTLIVVVFSKIIAAATVDADAFVVTVGPAGEVGAVVSGTLSVNGTVITFTPDAVLDTNSRYQVVINGDIKDLDSNGLDSDFTASFTTGDGT